MLPPFSLINFSISVNLTPCCSFKFTSKTSSTSSAPEPEMGFKTRPIFSILEKLSILATKKSLKIALKTGFLDVLSLQLAGKKQMSAAELLNGVTFNDNATAC